MRAVSAIPLALLLACSTASVPPASVESVPQQVAADVIKTFVESWNRSASGDTTGHQMYGTLYWPDAELVDPSGYIWSGRPAIVQMHVDLWGTAFKGSVVKGVVRRTRQLSPTLMVADFNLELKVAGPLPPVIPSSKGVVKTHLKNVMEKRDGEWKVVTSQNTFYSDAPPP